MRERNYVEGRNLVVKHASALGRAERLADLARDLVEGRVDVIVTTSTRETQAAKKATSTIPIVMTIPPDPVEQGLVASLARPGGNVTGLTNLVPGLRQKYVELLREVVPGASRFAVIASPGALGASIRRELETAATPFGLSLAILPVQRPDEFESALIDARKGGAAGVIVPADAVTLVHRRGLVGLVLKHRFQRDVIVAAGPALPTLKRANSTIPIVMAAVDDPVSIGYVQSLARPGGNITGLSFGGRALHGKRLE